MRHVIVIICLVAAISVAGCAPWVKTEYAPDASFSAIQTFTWKAPARQAVGDPILDSELLDERVRSAVNSTLSARGLTPVSAQNADVLVTYHTTKSLEIRSSPFAASIGMGRYWRDPFLATYPVYGNVVISNDVQSYDEGTLIIDIIDAKTKRLIWRGWRTHALQQKFFSAAGVRQTVEEILAKFPPGHDTKSR